jgi:phage-related minor tail protein
MGEAGTEAIMPVEKDSSGVLGVRANGVGGMNNSFEINISIDNTGKSTTGSDNTTGMDSSTARQLGTLVKNVVTQELVNQSRPGGLLAR